MNAAAFIRIKGLKTSRGCTMARVNDPIATILIPMMWCLASDTKCGKWLRRIFDPHNPRQITQPVRSTS